MHLPGHPQSLYIRNAKISLSTRNYGLDSRADENIASRKELVMCFKGDTELLFNVTESDLIFTFSTSETRHIDFILNNTARLQCRMRAISPRKRYRVQVECSHLTCNQNNSINVTDHTLTSLWSGCETIRDANYIFFSLNNEAIVTVGIKDLYSGFNASVVFRSVRIPGGDKLTLETRYMSPTRGQQSIYFCHYLCHCLFLSVCLSPPSVCLSVSLSVSEYSKSLFFSLTHCMFPFHLCSGPISHVQSHRLVGEIETVLH